MSKARDIGSILANDLSIAGEKTFTDPTRFNSDVYFNTNKYFVPAARLSWNSATDDYTNHYFDPYRIYRNIKRCILNTNGTVNYYLHPIDSTLKEDGTSANLDGTDGMVMVEIPKFYVRATFEGADESRRYTWEISEEPLSGFTIHPAFMLNGAEKDFRYIGAYDACLWDDSVSDFVSGLNYDDNTSRIDLSNDYLASVSGVYPMCGITRDEARTLAANLGSVWHLRDFYLSSAIQLLMLLEYGTFNMQSVISQGNTQASGWPSNSGNQSDSPTSIAGLSNDLGDSSGGISTSGGNRLADFVSWRGIENIFGNIWNWVDGFNVNDRQAYVSKNVSDFADDTATNYTALGSIMPSTSQYIRDMQGLEFAFLPSSISGGSSSTYITDYYYQNTGWCVARLGGSATNSLLAGTWYWSLTNDSSASARTIGARVTMKEKSCK